MLGYTRMTLLVTDFVMRLRTGKRIHLCEFETNELAEDLGRFFERIVEVPRIRAGGRRAVDTLICKEALLFARFLRDQRNGWIPGLVVV